MSVCLSERKLPAQYDATQSVGSFPNKSLTEGFRPLDLLGDSPHPVGQLQKYVRKRNNHVVGAGESDSVVGMALCWLLLTVRGTNAVGAPLLNKWPSLLGYKSL